MQEHQNQTFRNPAECGYRRIGQENGSTESAVCGLLQSLLQRPAEECTVSEEHCRACCSSFPPTQQCPNPVVSSLIVRVASQAIKNTENSDPERARLQKLWQFGLKHLPTENDLRSHERAVNLQIEPGSPFDVESRIPPPKDRCEKAVQYWAVGVTTAPRRERTLLKTVESLMKAGWTEPHLFVDGDVTLPEALGDLCATRRNPAVKAWPNYLLSILELLMRHPTADAFLMIQDDVCVFPHPAVKSYLERILWPGKKPGLVSLFCSREYTSEQSGWTRFPGRWLWGAQAFIFPREVAIQFVSHPMVIRHRWSRSPDGRAHIDWLIGEWAYRNRISVWYPTPSMVQHIGRVSAIWNAAELSGNRVAARFLGDELS